MVNLPRARLAILIDAENINPALVKTILTKLQTYKVLTLKRAYGDWSKPHLSQWKSILIEWGIQAIQAQSYTAGKNSADMMLTIDAMDLLLNHGVNWFYIISNDSDFTPLVHRLTASGAKVVGFGSSQASQAFAKACCRFIRFTDSQKLNSSSPIQPLLTIDSVVASPALQVIEGAAKQTTKTALLATITQSTQPSEKVNQKANQKQLEQILKQVYRQFSDQAGWINVGTFQRQLQIACSQRQLKFSCALFGCKKIEELVKKLGTVEWDNRQTAAQLAHRQFRLRQTA